LPGPQHGEVVVDVELRHVEALAADVSWQVGEKMDNLALAGGRAANKGEDVEGRVLLFTHYGLRST